MRRPRLARWVARVMRPELPLEVAHDGVAHTWTSYSESLADLRYIRRRYIRREALRAAIAERPTPKDQASDLVFVNSRGSPWVITTEKSRTDNVSVHFTNLMQNLGFHRNGIGFYTLRHVCRTVADAARDPVAIDLIMGHTDPSMGGHYRERVEDSRLQAVAEHVRT